LQTTLPVLDNPFSQRVNAVVQKSREMRRGVYYPQLYIVKEDGEMPLRLWALSLLIQDRADVMPSYQQFVNQLKDKVCAQRLYAFLYIRLISGFATGQWCQ
jgi:protein transport protein SEC24